MAERENNLENIEKQKKVQKERIALGGNCWRMLS